MNSKISAIAVGFTLGLGSLGCTAVAHAQDVQGPQFEISAGVIARADSNIARSDAARALSRGVIRSDQRLTPTLNIDINYPVGPHRLTLTGGAGYDFYRRNTQLNRERINAAGEAQLDFSICEPTFSAGISRGQSDFRELGFVPAPGIDGVRNAETAQNYRARLSCGGEFGLRPAAEVGYSIGNNSNLLRERADYRTTDVLSGLGYRHPSIGEILFYAGNESTIFPNRPLGTGRDGYSVKNYGFRFERIIGTRLKGKIGVAYSDLTPRNPATTNFSGVTWNGELTAIINPQFQLTGRVVRDIGSSLQNDASYNLSKNYSLDASYALNERLRLNGGISVASRRYVYDLVTPGSALERDNIKTIFAGLVFDANRRLSFNLDAGYERRNADGAFFDYKNVFVALGASIRF